MSVRLVGSAWLSAASIVLWFWLPTAGLADEFARTHRREIQEMVTASVKMESGIRAIAVEYVKKADLDPDSLATLAKAKLNIECYGFIHARFYAKYRALIDNIDTDPFTSIVDIRKNKRDVSVLRDPRKIAVATKYLISGFKWNKDFQPPAEDFAVRYSARPDLEAECTHYLDVTGMRN